MRSIMGHRWSNLGQRQLKRARALRASPRLEHLEQRDLLTNSLVVVPSPTVTQGALYGTAALANNDIWAVGGLLDRLARPPVFRPIAEHFDGNSWQVVPTPFLDHGDTLISVAGVASNDVWAVGAQYGPSFGFGESLIEHWDGSSWTIIDSPTSMVQHTALTGVTALASNDVWAVGQGVGAHHSDALVEHWDGSSWSVVSSPAFTGVPVDGISADASNDIWAFGLASTFFGGPFNGPAALHFDGTSWTAIPMQTQVGPGDRLSWGLTALSPTDVWAVGSAFDAYEHPRAAIAHWDGASWQDVPSPVVTGVNMSQLASVAAISPTDIWAVGESGDEGSLTFFTLTEHWDGTSWSIIPSPNPLGNRNELFAVTALSDGTVAAVGAQQDVPPSQSQTTPLILQNPESAPPGSGPAVPAAPLFVHASADPRLSFAGPSTVSKVAMLDTSLLQDQLNARSVDPVFAAGKPDPAPSFAGDRSLAPQGPEDHLGRTDAIDRLFTEWFVVPALAG
jgi:hypothetical protein